MLRLLSACVSGKKNVLSPLSISVTFNMGKPLSLAAFSAKWFISFSQHWAFLEVILETSIYDEVLSSFAIKK